MKEQCGKLDVFLVCNNEITAKPASKNIGDGVHSLAEDQENFHEVDTATNCTTSRHKFECKNVIISI